MKLFVLILSALLVHLSFASHHSRHRGRKAPSRSDQPLILTPLIEQEKIREARAASQVHFDEFKGLRSYSGFLTVNKPYNSNLFFWFFPAKTDYENAPVLLWIEGGPGVTSLYALFGQHGPFRVTNEGNLTIHRSAWTETHSVIFVENPVGTGFSFTNNGYSRNETQVGLDLYNGLVQFFQLFPELQKNDFFVTSQSYGGKFAPAIGYTIHTKNPSALLKINLKGITMGSGYSDPELQSHYADYIYQIGLIDSNTRKLMKLVEDEATESIRRKDWLRALQLLSSIRDGDESTNGTSILKNVTGFTYFFNFLYKDDPYKSFDNMFAYLARTDVRCAIHVGNVTFNAISVDVTTNLLDDILQSVAPWVAELLSHYQVIYYTGQLDMEVPYPMVVNYLQHLKFSGAEDYKVAPRYQWYVGNELAGYVKQAGNLTEVLVRNAGHLVTVEQPKFMYDLIYKFTRNQPLY